MVPIVARGLALLAVSVVLLAIALLLPVGTEVSGGGRSLRVVLVLAALVLGLFTLVMVPVVVGFQQVALDYGHGELGERVAGGKQDGRPNRHVTQTLMAEELMMWQRPVNERVRVRMHRVEASELEQVLPCAQVGVKLFHFTGDVMEAPLPMLIKEQLKDLLANN